MRILPFSFSDYLLALVTCMLMAASRAQNVVTSGNSAPGGDAAKSSPWTPADLGDHVWLDWRAEDLADGVVTSWNSRQGKAEATQATAEQQPNKKNGEVLFSANQRLNFPQQGYAHFAHRAVMILFRIDLTGSQNGSIFSANGAGGGGAERQPCVGYDLGKNLVTVGWTTPSGSNALSFNVPQDFSRWHCLVSRRVDTPSGPVHYASLDGRRTDGTTPGESELSMKDWALMKTNVPVLGFIGDNRTKGPQMAIDTIMVLQDQLTADDARKLMGWAMWRRGAQAQLPDAHPWRNQPPLLSPPTRAFVESTPAEFDALKVFWKDSAQSEAHRGEALDVSGWVIDFEDNFDKHTVTNDVTGKGNWFAPTHGAPCGKAVAVVPPLNKSDATIGAEGTPATYIHGDSTMTIRMQSTGKSESGALRWKSGAFCSVNSNGYGRTWMYPYIEARMKSGPSSTGNRKAAWPALWVKSVNYFYNLAESNLEYDIYEGYISDAKGFHNSFHNWPAHRKTPGRLEKHRWISNYLGLKTPGWPENIDLFDGKFHTYGVMVGPDFVINMFDGREVFRFPTPVEMKQPLWILVDLALSGYKDESLKADGIYDLVIDYIKVYRNPAFLPNPAAPKPKGLLE